MSEKNKQLKIYREKNNIDLLIVDENNGVVIAIENKVFAGERVDGEDGGQLKKYEGYIEKNYKNFKPYYIFLTVEHEDASDKEKWMNANYHMISDSIKEILNGDKDISLKTKIVFESYIDILKRTGVVKDDKVLELCKKIWDTESYRQALEIIIANKPTKANELKELLLSHQKIKIVDTKLNSGVYNYFIKFNETSQLIYRLLYSTKINKLGIMIVTIEREQVNNSNLNKILENKSLEQKRIKIRTSGKQFGYELLTDYFPICSEDEITSDRIQDLINILSDIDKSYNQLNLKIF